MVSIYLCRDLVAVRIIAVFVLARAARRQLTVLRTGLFDDTIVVFWLTYRSWDISNLYRTQTERKKWKLAVLGQSLPSASGSKSYVHNGCLKYGYVSIEKARAFSQTTFFVVSIARALSSWLSQTL